MTNLNKDTFSHILNFQNIDELCKLNINKMFQKLQKNALISLLIKLRFNPYNYDDEYDHDRLTTELLVNHNLTYLINKEFDKKIILKMLSKEILIRSMIEYDTKIWSEDRKTIPEIDIGDILTNIGFSYKEFVELTEITQFVIGLVLTNAQLKQLLEHLTKSQLCNIFKILFKKFGKETIMDFYTDKD